MNNSLLGSFITVSFFLSFVAILIWSLWPSNKAKLEKNALIPLQDDNDPLSDKGHEVSSKSMKSKEMSHV